MSAFKNIEIIRKYFFELFIILLALLFILVQIIYSSGNLTPDALEYIKQAKFFWSYKANFPLFYPSVIKVFNFFVGNLFITSKIINVLTFLATIYFSYQKRFYFRETVLLFSFYPFINFYSTSLSEPLFFFLNYLMIYYAHQIIHQDFRKVYFIWLPIICFLIVATRFSGIFTVFPTLLFIYLSHFRSQKLRQKILQLVITSSLATLSYLFINKIYCGYFLGKRDHLAILQESNSNFTIKILESFGKDFSLLNAFLHKGILTQFSQYHWLATVTMLAYIAFEVTTQKLYKKKWIQFLLLSAVFSLMGILYSYYTTRIDETIRIKSNAYFFIMMILLFVMRPKILKTYQFVVAALLIFNTYTLIYYSESITANILKNDELLRKTKCKEININKKEKNSQILKSSKFLLFTILALDHDIIIRENEQSSNSNKNCEVDIEKIVQ